jgi:hypothetical protein
MPGETLQPIESRPDVAAVEAMMLDHFRRLLRLGTDLHRRERDVKNLSREARELGHDEAAECLKTAQAAIEDAREELKR